MRRIFATAMRPVLWLLSLEIVLPLVLAGTLGAFLQWARWAQPAPPPDPAQELPAGDPIPPW
jgi:hypothetical protein